MKAGPGSNRQLCGEKLCFCLSGLIHKFWLIVLGESFKIAPLKSLNMKKAKEMPLYLS